MIFNTMPEFLNKLGHNGALIGLDLGSKTIGIAVSDTRQTIATGIKTLKRTKFQKDLLALESIIKNRDVKGIIVGLPKNMDGSEGPRCQSTRSFAYNMAKKILIPITFWDERLSTIAAERSLLEANTSRHRRAKVVDYVAASFILQGALNRLSVMRKGAKFE